MDKQTKDDIIELINSYYHIPGEYFTATLVLFGFYVVLKNLTNLSLICLFCGLLFLVMEFLSPIFAGQRLLKKIIKLFQ
jgi:hypothetical protein